MAAQEKQKRFEHFRAFERDWLLSSDSHLVAHAGAVGCCYLSYLNIQVAMGNADLSRKTNMRKQQLSTSRLGSDISQ